MMLKLKWRRWATLLGDAGDPGRRCLAPWPRQDNMTHTVNPATTIRNQRFRIAPNPEQLQIVQFNIDLYVYLIVYFPI